MILVDLRLRRYKMFNWGETILDKARGYLFREGQPKYMCINIPNSKPQKVQSGELSM